MASNKPKNQQATLEPTIGFSDIGTNKDPLVSAYGMRPLFSYVNGQKVVNTKIPGAASYLQAANLAKLAYGNALARINSGRSNTLRQYGYTANFDPQTGVVQNMRVDPNNPYGQYQDLLHSGAQAASQAFSQGISRNIGVGGGLAGQLQSQVRTDFGRNSATLGTNLSSALFQYQDQQNTAKYEQDKSLYEAEQQALQEAIAARMFTLQQQLV